MQRKDILKGWSIWGRLITVIGVITLVFWVVGLRYPIIVEQLYFGQIFQGIRSAYDTILGWLPFPSVYVVLPIFIWVIGWHLKKVVHVFKPFNGIKSILMGGGYLLRLIMIIGAWFYWSWGFNYMRIPVDKHLELDFNLAVDSTVLMQEAITLTETMVASRMAIDTADKPLKLDLDVGDLENHIRPLLVEVLYEMDYPTSGKPRIRNLKPSGTLLRISTAGVYLPFVFEGHIDAGLHDIQKPFTLAHEMTHAYGFTDEGVCNFIGYLACLKSDQPLVQYSAHRVYWQYIMRHVKELDTIQYDYLRGFIPKGIYADTRAISEQMDRYPDLMPQVRDVIYDSYLKSHGVKAGLTSYSQMVAMVLAYKEVNEKMRK